MNFDGLVWGSLNLAITKCSFCVHETCEINGVKAICKKITAETVLGYNPVNRRLISVRLK